VIRALAKIVIASVVLLAVGTACSSSERPAQPQGYVPPQLVGSWCGGSDSAPEGHWTWTFYPNGNFSAENPYRPTISGISVVSGGMMTTYSTTGMAQRHTINLGQDQLLGTILYIDSYSYLPGHC
jgi:hypothetical protein